IVIPPAIFFYYSTLFDSRFKTLQQNRFPHVLKARNKLQCTLLSFFVLLVHFRQCVRVVCCDEYAT
ncbi:hypothetical protein P7H30_11440, partial [Streptococcus parauberis]|uniref:hypothetical protein n=1 Tax=Streptococcus parauberis TaxID=1348 RepID=UPI002890E196